MLCPDQARSMPATNVHVLISRNRDFLRRNNECIRWIDGKYQLADSLATIMPSDFFRNLMQLGTYRLTEEYDALKSLKLRKESKLHKQPKKELEECDSYDSNVPG